MNAYILIIIIFTIIIYIFNKYYTTLRYKFMVFLRNFKMYINKHNVYILNGLNKLNYYIEQLLVFLDTNIIVRELINNNKIPLKFILFVKTIFDLLNKFIIFIIKFINK